MDEQRFRARLAALEFAHLSHGFVTDGYIDAVLTVAAAFEGWLMRLAPIDVSGVDQASGSVAIMQQPCGAFLRPDWFEGGPNDWNVCSGEHVTSPGTTHGWHRRTGVVGGVFATHHHVHTIEPPNRCACGGPWPCTAVVSTPTADCDVETTADWLGYPRCDTVWRKTDGRLHRCRYIITDHDPGCICTCGDRPAT